MKRLTLATLVLVATPAVAKTPAFDPRAWHGTQAGSPTQMLTIGSAHLSQIKPIDRTTLGPLLDRLAAWKPDIITLEGISGEQCDILKRYEARYPRMFETYCWDTDDAQNATGLSVPQALAEIETTLANWPNMPSTSQRRHLAALFLAANDRPSAQVQWLQLAPSDRTTGDGIDAALLATLTRANAKPNESYDIAVALAVRLGHSRVYLVDDHSADSIQATAGADFDATLGRLWSRPKPPVAVTFDARSNTLPNGAAVLDFYRFLNTPATQRAFVDADFGYALKDNAPGLHGRRYVAWYETRNLRMVAAIRAAAAQVPGGRVLNIVGASHKPYYDAYLAMMSDVRIVDAEPVLR